MIEIEGSHHFLRNDGAGFELKPFKKFPLRSLGMMAEPKSNSLNFFARSGEKLMALFDLNYFWLSKNSGERNLW
jgi:hypothetical protein